MYSCQGQVSADGPLIRLVGDARFSKVAVHRGHYDPNAPWQHWQQLAQEMAKPKTQQG